MGTADKLSAYANAYLRTPVKTAPAGDQYFNAAEKSKQIQKYFKMF